MAQVRATPPAQLAALEGQFRDPRLPELLFRYRARNWPQSLSIAEQARWDDYRRQRLQQDSGLSELSFDAFYAELAGLRLAHPQDATKQALLDQLAAWGHDLQRSL
ncbi:hypothetical protein NB689_002517 [Xanthomonas sacchari]|nr:hypothetical protein [Xanthomonas sacchari]MCW0450894.1 hypothetical protein [Xanthomonas sacchari]